MSAVGYRLNCLDEPVFMAVSKPLLTEFGIHHRLESCGISSWTSYAYDKMAILISEQSKSNKCLRLCSKQNIKSFPSKWQPLATLLGGTTDEMF